MLYSTYHMQRYNGRHHITILLHGVVSSPDTTSCDKLKLKYLKYKIHAILNCFNHSPYTFIGIVIWHFVEVLQLVNS